MENVDVFEMEMGKHSEIGMHKVEAESVSNNEMPQIIEAQQDLCDNVVISIQKMLNQMHSINGDCSIYRIPKQLREMNPKAYTPQLISIGPFHHYRRQNDFKATEQYKLQALVNFLRRINNNNETMEEDQDVKKSRSLDDLLKIGTLKVLVEKVHCWMTETRNCYSEPIDYMDDHNFVIMMLLDACFIVESFIQQYDASYPHDRKFPRIQDNVDFLLLYPETSQDISNDLIKLENQVPFFLLQHMFHMIPQHSPPVSFINLTYSALYDWFISTYKICSVGIVPNEPKHLVHFLSFYFIPSHTSLLVNSGVIINNIGGSDKEVSELFNNLGKFVNQCPSPYMFNHISKALRKHCNGRWNKAKASLKHNYFNTPWAFISFFAASFLVLLTLLQTIFSGISAFPS